MAIEMALAVLAGALLQRVSGLGFALVASPFLVLIVGPHQGIVLSNLLGILVSGSVLLTVRRDVDLSRAAILVPAGLIGVLPGVTAARGLPSRPLQVIIGGLVAAGLVTTIIYSRLRVEPTPSRTAAFGLVSGFMSATAGIGGPALAVYARATSWRQEAFAATAQLSFVAQAILALTFEGLPQLRWKVLAALAGAATAGLVAGHFLTQRIPPQRARVIVIVIAFLGATATVVRALS